MNNEMPDRRRSIDRRNERRFTVSIDIEWEDDSLGRFTGTISDLSESGCFVLSGGKINEGDSVRLSIPLADGMKVQYAGRVMNSALEIGFAVLFDPLSPAQVSIIQDLIKDGGPA